MSETKDYSKLIEQAEKAVSSVKDESLRKIAFEKLVSHLLDGNSSNGDEDDNDSQKKPKAKRAKHSTSKSVKSKTGGPKVWIEELIAEKFFSKPKSSADIRQELESRSHHLSPTDITMPLQNLCHEKKLRRKKETGGKLHWVNW